MHAQIAKSGGHLLLHDEGDCCQPDIEVSLI
jgi:hypothetical protein